LNILQNLKLVSRKERKEKTAEAPQVRKIPKVEFLKKRFSAAFILFSMW
jgi:hypothetical protein